MKISRLATLTALIFAAGSSVASSQTWPGPIEQGYVAYHYNQEFEPRYLVAVSGLNCDGTSYHEPLQLGQYIEYTYFDC
ncbi:hypothetical protein QE419_001576 [Brevundimonas vesicularis]|uniref:hypothetical protein n=1 Tax=uncultured Brevundimonas sp. TaxID=213418 RepID=UPI0025F35187|nr:hypothetical protein [uncultured Brevundimonas sp.]MDQ1192810.1 hypothetical protein [Brevundimonas vesicularis]